MLVFFGSSVPQADEKENTMFKQLLFCSALVTMLMVNPANAQQSPTSEKAKQIEPQVEKAVALTASYTPTPADLASFANSDLLTAGYFGGP